MSSGWTRKEEKVRITYSEAIGELLEAKFSPDAKVSVVGVYHGPTDPPLTAMVTANTTNAIAGEWELTLTGDAGACIGKAWVGRVER